MYCITTYDSNKFRVKVSNSEFKALHVVSMREDTLFDASSTLPEIMEKLGRRTYFRRRLYRDYYAQSNTEAITKTTAKLEERSKIAMERALQQLYKSPYKSPWEWKEKLKDNDAFKRLRTESLIIEESPILTDNDIEMVNLIK